MVLPYTLNQFWKQIYIKQTLYCIRSTRISATLRKQQKWTCIMRYWDPIENRVKVRYCDSSFLGHEIHTDFLNHFKSITNDYPSKKAYQVSMDGPNVNSNFCREFSRHDETSKRYWKVIFMSCITVLLVVKIMRVRMTQQLTPSRFLLQFKLR